jgi:MFS family permease
MSRFRDLIPGLPRDAWVVLGADALSAVGTGLTLPFLLVYLHGIRGIPLAIAGLAVSMIAAGSVAGNLAGGILSDRLGARAALILGLAIAAAGTAMLILVAAPWHAFAATATAGLGAGMIWPAQDALLATVVTPAQRSSVFSVRMASMNAGLGIGALAAAALVDGSSAHSFTVLYLLNAASFLAVIPILFTLAAPARPRTVGPAQPPAGSYRQVVADKTFLRVWALTALLVALSYGQMSSAFPAYATGTGGIPASALGLAFAANTITVVIAQLLVLRAMRGRRRTTGIIAACAGWSTAWTLTLLAGHLGHGPTATTVFVLAMVVFGIAETFLSPSLTPIVNDLAPATLTGRYNGLSTLAWTTGFLTGPAIAGLSLGADQGSALFAGLILACAAAAIGTLRLQQHLPAQANTIAA